MTLENKKKQIPNKAEATRDQILSNYTTIVKSKKKSFKTKLKQLFL